MFTAPAAEKKPEARKSSGSYTVTVNGTDYAVSSSNGTFTVNGTAYSVTVKDAAGSAAPATPAPAAPKPQPAATPKPAAAPAASGSGAKLLAPVTGTLLRYTVAEGTKVNEGQTVIMLESMKMELEINAPAAGTVHFTAAVGTQVGEGDLLAEIQ